MLEELVSKGKVTEIEGCVPRALNRQQVNKWLQEESGKLEERALESRFLRAEKGQFLRF